MLSSTKNWLLLTRNISHGSRSPQFTVSPAAVASSEMKVAPVSGRELDLTFKDTKEIYKASCAKEYRASCFNENSMNRPHGSRLNVC